jgi:hypothetical protein
MEDTINITDPFLIKNTPKNIGVFLIREMTLITNQLLYSRTLALFTENT